MESSALHMARFWDTVTRDWDDLADSPTPHYCLSSLSPCRTMSGDEMWWSVVRRSSYHTTDLRGAETQYPRRRGEKLSHGHS